jgi:hypothetical protein
MKLGLKKIALSAESDLSGRERDKDREAIRTSLGVLEAG